MISTGSVLPFLRAVRLHPLAPPGRPRPAARAPSGQHPASIQPAKSPAAAPHQNALIIIAIPAGGGASAASYSLALGRATPHHITVGLIGHAGPTV
jgi:hypothetical protein